MEAIASNPAARTKQIQSSTGGYTFNVMQERPGEPLNVQARLPVEIVTLMLEELARLGNTKPKRPSKPKPSRRDPAA